MRKIPEHSSHNKPQEAVSQKPALGTSGSGIDHVDGLMSDVIFRLRVNQLVTTLRATHPINGEACTMLSTLESLVIAGEITFPDFMQRVQNLFPHVFDDIEPELRDNLLRMLTD